MPSITVVVLQTQAKEIYIIKINGAINQPVAGFVKESIEKTQEQGAEALVISLDTPGGFDTSMRDIVKNVMDAAVPFIVYVSPSGARGASGGSIILMASHIAAMAPVTNVGAAHPVAIEIPVAEKTTCFFMKMLQNNCCFCDRQTNMLVVP